MGMISYLVDFIVCLSIGIVILFFVVKFAVKSALRDVFGDSKSGNLGTDTFNKLNALRNEKSE